MNVADGQSKDIMALPTLSGDKGIETKAMSSCLLRPPAWKWNGPRIVNRQDSQKANNVYSVRRGSSDRNAQSQIS